MNKEVDPSQAQSIRELVRSAIRDLTVSEQKVGRILLAAYPIAGLESVAQLAERAQVSGPTVLRFVSKLGFDGYGAFQETLREEVQERLTVPDDGSSRRSMIPEEILQIGRDTYVRSIEATFDSISAGQFGTALDLLSDSHRRVFCAGGRFSQVLAFYLYALLDRVRPECRYINAEPALRIRELAEVHPGDLLAVFDYYPYEVSTIDFARRASQGGLDIIVFTDPWQSPIAAQATCVLTSSLESPSLSGSLVSGTAIVESVAAGLAARLEKDVRLQIEENERRLAASAGNRTALKEEETGWNHKPKLGQR